MALRPEQKPQPQMQPAPLAGPRLKPQPIGPKPAKPFSSGGAKLARNIALGILPIALLGYAAVASGFISVPAFKPDAAHSIAAKGPSSSSVKAEQNERDTLGRIGASVSDLTEDVIKSMALQTGRLDGVVVRKVWPNSSAERAGLLNGDIILAVDGIPVGEVSEFVTKIEYTPINQNLTLILERGGVTQVLPVQVERWCTNEMKVSDLCSAR